MADAKVTALTETTSPATSDLVYVVTTPGGTPASKKCTIANLKTAMGAPVALASGSYTRSAGTYTTTSTTFADVDTTNMKHVITTGARRVMIVFSGEVSFAAGPNSVDFDVDLDGSRVSGQAAGIVRKFLPDTNWDEVCFTWITDALSAASHTFKLQWKVASAGTISLYGAGSAWPARFAVVELLA